MALLAWSACGSQSRDVHVDANGTGPGSTNVQPSSPGPHDPTSNPAQPYNVYGRDPMDPYGMTPEGGIPQGPLPNEPTPSEPVPAR
jgi:hypothetical protein